MACREKIFLDLRSGHKYNSKFVKASSRAQNCTAEILARIFTPYDNSLQEQQKTLQSDVERMTEQVARSESEVCRLSEALRRKEDGRNTDARDARQYEAEVCRLRAKTESMEDSHDSQIEGMKVQMSNLTEELHQRNTAFANLTDKLAHTENQYKQEVMKHQKDVGDFELTKAQLDALRHENKHLKQTVLSQSETANDVKKFEGMLRKLEKEYNHAVEKLQIENRKLKQDLDEMMMDRSPACQRRSYGMGSASRSRQKNNSSQWEDHQDLISSFNDETSHTYQFNNSASKPAYTELLQSPPRSRAPHTKDFTKTYQLNNNASVPGYTDAQQSTAQSHATRTEDLPGSPRFSGQFNNNNANILNQGASPQSSQHLLITGIGNLSQSQGSVDKSNLFLEGLPSPQRSPAAAKEYVSSLLPPSMPANGKDIFSQSNPSTSFSSSLGFEQQVVPPIRDGSGGGTEMWHLNMSTDRPSSRASISGQFLAEEQQRSNDLQRNIDILIEDFEMNNTTRSPDRL